ncbi:YolA family protein [Gynuella sp.]|uniref:YolA family protein n=1 Tax=Gynuella sp. TaxID=2969146 RepID=UPI003D0FE9E6
MHIKTLLIAIVPMIAVLAGTSAIAEQQSAIKALPRLDSGQISPPDVQLKPESNTAMLAPAPPLTEMWVYAVGSSDCGWEGTAGKYITSCDHGGSQMRAAVLEIGYGYSEFAWMNGSLLPSSAQYSNTTVCVTGGYYTWPCTAGQTVVGFLREFNLDGNQSGTFKYRNTSTNSPWNTMNVQINIR